MFVFKKFVDKLEETGVRRDTLLLGQERITTKVVIAVTDCGAPQLIRVFNTQIEGKISLRTKVFKDLLKSIKNEIFAEAGISEFPRLVVKFVNYKGYVVDKREYWIESK